VRACVHKHEYVSMWFCTTFCVVALALPYQTSSLAFVCAILLKTAV